MAPEREDSGLSELLLRAVADARRLRGSVMVEPPGGRCWGAVVAAVDGSLEIRVSPPGRLRFGARKWLGANGYTFDFDAWILPLGAATPDDAAARALADALAAAHGAAAERRMFEHAGALDDDRPPADAPPEVHVAAALRTLLDGRWRGVDIGGGRPTKHWADAWPVDGELLVLRDMPGRPGYGEDEWRAPLTNAGCESAANELLRRMRADGAETEPLFIQLLDHDE